MLNSADMMEVIEANEVFDTAADNDRVPSMYPRLELVSSAFTKSLMMV
jgi:hypothetical protein